MYEIEFYENENGDSDVWNYLEELRIRSLSNKDARIQYRKITFYIELLSQNGSSLSENIMKNIYEDIWELRPGVNRIFYFFYDKDSKYILLHHFRKKTQKTPLREIKKAKYKRDNYILRKEREQNENME